MNENSSLSISAIVKKSLFYWSKTLKFQLLFSLIAISFYFVFIYVFLSKTGMLDYVASLDPSDFSDKEFVAQYTVHIGTILQQNASFLALFVLLPFLLVFPLHIGMFQIFKKIDTEEKIQMSDLFVGYQGVAFFRYASYAFFWFSVNSLLAVFQFTLLIYLAKLAWVALTLLVPAFLFFTNISTMQAISTSYQVVKKNVLLFISCALIAFLFRYAGFFVFVFGFLLTFPFWSAMSYALFRSLVIITKPEQPKKDTPLDPEK